MKTLFSFTEVATLRVGAVCNWSFDCTPKLKNVESPGICKICEFWCNKLLQLANLWWLLLFCLDWLYIHNKVMFKIERFKPKLSTIRKSKGWFKMGKKLFLICNNIEQTDINFVKAKKKMKFFVQKTSASISADSWLNLSFSNFEDLHQPSPKLRMC